MLSEAADESERWLIDLSCSLFNVYRFYTDVHALCFSLTPVVLWLMLVCGLMISFYFHFRPSGEAGGSSASGPLHYHRDLSCPHTSLAGDGDWNMDYYKVQLAVRNKHTVLLPNRLQYCRPDVKDIFCQQFIVSFRRKFYKTSKNFCVDVTCELIHNISLRLQGTPLH